MRGGAQSGGHWRRVSAGRSAGLCGAPRMRGGRRRGRRAGRGCSCGPGMVRTTATPRARGGTRETPTPHFRRGRRVLLERRPRRKARRPVRGQPRRHRSTRLRHPSLQARFLARQRSRGAASPGYDRSRTPDRLPREAPAGSPSSISRSERGSWSMLAPPTASSTQLGAHPVSRESPSSIGGGGRRGLAFPARRCGGRRRPRLRC